MQMNRFSGYHYLIPLIFSSSLLASLHLNANYPEYQWGKPKVNEKFSGPSAFAFGMIRSETNGMSWVEFCWKSYNGMHEWNSFSFETFYILLILL